MAVTFRDEKVSDYEFGSDEDGNFITFIATTVVDDTTTKCNYSDEF